MMIGLRTSVFPSPRSAVVAWLLAPSRSIGPEGDAELRQSLFLRLEAVLVSAGLTLAVTGLASWHHPTWPFLCWLTLDIALASVRIPLVIHLMRCAGGNRRRIRPWTIDLFVWVGTLWSGMLGFGTMLCLATGNPGLSILAALIAMGTVGAQCARNPGAPRLNALQMALIVVPFSAGAATSTIPLAIYSAALIPLYFLGMINITRALHADYVSLMVARLDNRYRALHCPLTGLPNRTFFDERLVRSLNDVGRGMRRVVVMYLDLDGFKAVNDIHGHPAGDCLLREVGARLAAHVPPGALVARLGGDEFAVLLESDDAKAAEACARALIDAIVQPFVSGIGSVMVGVSVGIATGNDAERLVAHADAALYEAKRAGRGTFRWHWAEDTVAAQSLRDIALRMRVA